MEISNIIAILLFILPGILAERISFSIDCPSRVNQSEFRETVRGMILSLPIVLASSIGFSIFRELETLNKFIEALNQLSNLLVYIGIILIVSIVIGVVDGMTMKLRARPINYLRGKLNKMPSDGRSCWQRFLIDQNIPRYLEVIYDGNSYKGFANRYSSTNENAAIVLEINDVLYEYSDFNSDELFNKVTGIYIDAEKNIVIKDYDMSEYNKWCDEKESLSNPS